MLCSVVSALLLQGTYYCLRAWVFLLRVDICRRKVTAVKGRVTMQPCGKHNAQKKTREKGKNSCSRALLEKLVIASRSAVSLGFRQIIHYKYLLGKCWHFSLRSILLENITDTELIFCQCKILIFR